MSWLGNAVATLQLHPTGNEAVYLLSCQTAAILGDLGFFEPEIKAGPDSTEFIFVTDVFKMTVKVSTAFASVDITNPQTSVTVATGNYLKIDIVRSVLEWISRQTPHPTP